MSFANLYYKRTAATAKACYVCSKPSTTVLATINTTDFIYACPTHLTDPGFATRVQEEKPKPSEEDIARVKKEWEEKKKKKQEEEKKEKEEDKKDDEPKKEKEKEFEKPQSPTPKPSHEKYTLHRDMFSMRQYEHRKSRQTSQAKELGPRLPGAPNTVIDLSTSLS
ncbi:hypothetical protein V5O48_009717 [Marasmius crinis-equi]|uniref:DUF1742-domain-containing protein n=1 Tax=Marasmius crinis-equi TaxID=585013 RepID=A0ABR3FAC5_9AGAR